MEERFPEESGGSASGSDWETESAYSIGDSEGNFSLSEKKPWPKRPQSGYWAQRISDLKDREWSFPLDVRFSARAVREISSMMRFPKYLRGYPYGVGRIFPHRESLQAHNMRVQIMDTLNEILRECSLNNELLCDSLRNSLLRATRLIKPYGPLSPSNPLEKMEIRIWAQWRLSRRWRWCSDRFDPTTKLW